MPRYFRSNDGTEVRVNVPNPVDLEEEFKYLLDSLNTESECDTINLSDVNKAIDAFKERTAYLSRIEELISNGYVEYQPPSKLKKTKTPKVVIDEVILNEDGTSTSLKVIE